MSRQRSKTICHLVLSLNPGGMENGVINVATGIINSDFQQRILCIREKGTMAQRLPQGIPVDCLGYQKGFSILGVMRIIIYLWKNRVAILYSHNPATLTWGGLALLLRPQTKWIHGEHGFADSSKSVKSLQKWLIKRCDRITAVSENLIDESRKFYQNVGLRIQVITNGVDTDKYRPTDPTEKGHLRRQLEIPEEGFVFLCSGRLEPRKNQEFALKVVSNLIARDTKHIFHLILAGGGKDELLLKMTAKTMGIESSVSFLGFRTDMPKIYSCCDLLLLPSLRGEGMANAILEGNSSGLPVIASDIPGNRIIVDEGQNGYVLSAFEHENIEQWVSRILQLCADEKKLELLSASSRTKMVQEFSISQMVENYRDLYEASLR